MEIIILLKKERKNCKNVFKIRYSNTNLCSLSQLVYDLQLNLAQFIIMFLHYTHLKCFIKTYL